MNYLSTVQPLSFPEKLRVMADYDSSGIWVMEAVGPFRNGMISHENLGLPSELSHKFNMWIGGYWNRLDNENFDVDGFNATGRELTKELKRFLGSETNVEYFPELSDGDIGQVETID